MTKHTLLCVDDEFDNVDALERLFRKKYRVLKATSGQAALDLMAKEKTVSMILSDQRMPGMSGVEMLRESIKHHPFAIRILLTGFSDMSSVVDAVNTGEIYRYLTKPWDPVDLAQTVDQGIEKYELSAELKIKNRELKKAFDELQGLDLAKTQFMVLINHELKTPLTTLLSFAQLLRETPVDEDQLKYINRIVTSGDRLREITEDVLQLLSAESGLLQPKLQKCTLESLLPELGPPLENEKFARGLKIQLEMDSIKVKTDRDLVTQVLRRILHNAIKFAKPNSEIWIRARQDYDQIRVSVENTGETLSRAQIERILKPFTLNEDMMNHSRGMGLGLSLCQALLKTLESSLEIESASQRVKVSFALPVA